ncbi:MAG: DMT family transporter [Actinomycetota bacterium]
MLYGLGAALGWGIADFVGAISGRRIGALPTLLFAQVSSLIVLAVALLVLGEPLNTTGPETAVLLANGAIGAGAYVALYKALTLGPVALVSPIVGSYSAITIVLAIVLRNETVTGLALLGIWLTLIGVVLAALNLRELRGRASFTGPGIPWALASMALFGVATFVLARYSQDVGWAGPVFLSRLGDVIVVVILAAFLRRRFTLGVGARNLGIAFASGASDVGGVVFYALGVEAGMISIVSASSVAFILIPVFGALILFKERPALTQWAGVVGVAAGLLLLGLDQ